MTTETTEVNQDQERNRIWEELDREEAGGTPAQRISIENSNQDNGQQTEEQHADDARAQETGSQSDGNPSDSGSTGDEAASQPPNLLDKVAGLESQLTGALARLRQAEGHIGTLNSRLQQQQQVAQQVSAKGGDAPTASELANAQKSTEAMARLKEDYPEFGAALEATLAAELAQLRQQQLVQQQPTEGAVTQADLAKMQVEVRHPGWETTVKAPEFAGWLQRQPRERQLLAASASPQDAVRLLDLYTEDSKSRARPNQQRLASAAALPSGRPGAQVRQKPVEEMTPKEFWAYRDQIEAQQQKG